MKIRLTLVHLILGLLPFFLMVSCSKAQKSPKLLEDLTPYIETKMEEYHVPGLAVGIVKGEKLIYAQGFGYRDVKRRLPVTLHTLFAIGSTTKAITAVGLCQLVDRNLLDLDQPLHHYLPKFKLADEYITQHITTRDLLCHRSGLPRHDLVWYGSNLKRKEIIQRLKYLESSKGFRSHFQYQNMMYVTAGHLVNYISGKSWEEYTRTNILEPLEMVRTNFSVEISKKDSDHALPYSKENGKVVNIPFRKIDAIGPAGSINSCIQDLSHWVAMQLNKGKYQNKQIVSSKMLKETHTPQIVVPGDPNNLLFYSFYGLGWGVTSYRGHLRVAHGGSIDGFISEIALFPKDTLGIILLTNLTHNDLTVLLRNKLADHFLKLTEYDWESHLKREKRKHLRPKYVRRVTNTDPSQVLEAYTGKYKHPAYGILEITIQQYELHLHFNSFDTPLIHYHYDTFEAQNSAIATKKFTFHPGKRGIIERISVPFQEGVEDIVFTRVESEP
ncbi:MAG: serine hydrolase [Marinifilaceae bacterium]